MSGESPTVQRRRLKLASSDLVTAFGRQDAAAHELGKSQSQIQRCCSPNDDNNFLNIGQVAQLEQLSGSTAVTEALARVAGGVFIPLPDPDISDNGELPMQIVDATKELGEVSEAVRDGLRDGSLDPDDLQRVRSEVEDLVRVAIEMRMMVDVLLGVDPLRPQPDSIPISENVKG